MTLVIILLTKLLFKKIHRVKYCSPKGVEGRGTKGTKAGVGSSKLKPCTRDIRDLIRGMEKKAKAPVSLVPKTNYQEGESIDPGIPRGVLGDRSDIKGQIQVDSLMDFPSQKGVEDLTRISAKRD